MTSALIFLGLGLVIFGGGAIWIVAHRMGRMGAENRANEANVEAAERIADAEAHAPSNVSDLTQRLRDDGHL